jgi:hypothetical protein
LDEIEVLKMLYEYNESGRLEIKGSEVVEKVLNPKKRYIVRGVEYPPFSSVPIAIKKPQTLLQSTSATYKEQLIRQPFSYLPYSYSIDRLRRAGQ